MRTFETGATRNSVEGKLSYMRALSPEVLRYYVGYLARHRKQADGGTREFDNWKHGIPQDAYCDGLLRHTHDAWLTFFDYTPSDMSYDLKDLLCAIIFNAQGWLFELICNERRECIHTPDPKTLQIEAEYDKGVAATAKPPEQFDCRQCARQPKSLFDQCLPGLKSEWPDCFVPREPITDPAQLLSVGKTCGECGQNKCEFIGNFCDACEEFIPKTETKA
jgi:hypothetical protein